MPFCRQRLAPPPARKVGLTIRSCRTCPGESLPRLPNGKIDRVALQSLDRRRSVAINEAPARLSPTEEQLVQIWSDVLKLDSVSSNDNFFDLAATQFW